MKYTKHFGSSANPPDLHSGNAWFKFFISMLVVVSSFISDEEYGLVDVGLRDWRKTLNMGLLFTILIILPGQYLRLGLHL